MSILCVEFEGDIRSTANTSATRKTCGSGRRNRWQGFQLLVLMVSWLKISKNVAKYQPLITFSFLVRGSGFDGCEEDELWTQQAMLGEPCSSSSLSFLSAMKSHIQFFCLASCHEHVPRKVMSTQAPQIPKPRCRNQLAYINPWSRIMLAARLK